MPPSFLKTTTTTTAEQRRTTELIHTTVKSRLRAFPVRRICPIFLFFFIPPPPSLFFFTLEVDILPARQVLRAPLLYVGEPTNHKGRREPLASAVTSMRADVGFSRVTRLTPHTHMELYRLNLPAEYREWRRGRGKPIRARANSTHGILIGSTRVLYIRSITFDCSYASSFFFALIESCFHPPL